MSEIQQLRDRVEELEALFGLHSNLPHPFGLSSMQEKYIGVLLRRKIASSEMLLTAIYGGLTDRSSSIVGVHIKNIRRKLAPHGLTIRNRYNEGYYLDDHARSVLKEVRAQCKENAA